MSVLKTSLRNFLAHKGRMALSAVAVLLSVAFVSGTLVFTDTMNTTFDKLFATTASDVTVSPKGRRPTTRSRRPAAPRPSPPRSWRRSRRRRAPGTCRARSPP